MKKFRKLLAVGCLLCLVLPLLCGCNALDEARKKQAFYDEDGNILWNGTVYKLLPKGEYFSPEIHYGEGNDVFVTKPDVPVLLQDSFCEEWLIADEEGVLLENYRDYNYGDYRYYCREDRYEEIAKRLEEPFQGDMVCYRYYFYDEEKGEYVDAIYRLTDDQWGVLKKILETEKPVEMGEGWNLDYNECVNLEECSEDMLFRREFLEVLVCGNAYYLRLNDGWTTKLYQVPAEAIPHMEEIMEAERTDYLPAPTEEAQTA